MSLPARSETRTRARPVEVDPPDADNAPEPSAGDTPIEPAVPAAVEAVLLSLDRPITAGRLAEAMGLGPGAGTRAVRDAVDALNREYESTGRSFRIEQVAGGFRIMTMPRWGEVVAKFHASRASAKLSRPALETLAVIAYRQPVTRVQVEAIRGVACGEVLRTLLERRLIAIVGRAEELGRPMLYGVSKQFLELFGLSSVKDLPAVAELAIPSLTVEEPEHEASDEAASRDKEHEA